MSAYQPPQTDQPGQWLPYSAATKELERRDVRLKCDTTTLRRRAEDKGEYLVHKVPGAVTLIFIPDSLGKRAQVIDVGYQSTIIDAEPHPAIGTTDAPDAQAPGTVPVEQLLQVMEDRIRDLQSTVDILSKDRPLLQDNAREWKEKAESSGKIATEERIANVQKSAQLEARELVHLAQLKETEERIKTARLEERQRLLGIAMATLVIIVMTLLFCREQLPLLAVVP